MHSGAALMRVAGTKHSWRAAYSSGDRVGLHETTALRSETRGLLPVREAVVRRDKVRLRTTLTSMVPNA